jgi:hypothetical protein
MNVPGWGSKVTETLVLVLVVAVAARVVWGLLGPLVPGLILFLIVGAVLIGIFRGPRPGGGLFH